MNRLLFSLFLAAPLIPVSTTGMAQQQFDGRWTVTTIPEKGACRRKHHYAVVVENGVARNAFAADEDQCHRRAGAGRARSGQPPTPRGPG